MNKSVVIHIYYWFDETYTFHQINLLNIKKQRILYGIVVFYFKQRHKEQLQLFYNESTRKINTLIKAGYLNT